MVVKLLVITPVYYPEVGGGALAVYLMVDLLAKVEGLKITVLTGCNMPKRTKGIDYVYDPFLKVIDKNLYPPQLLFERYGRIMRAHDVVYIVYAFPLIPVAKKLGKKTIVHLHDYRPISPSGTILAGSEKSSLVLIKDSFTISIMRGRGVKDLIKNTFNIPYTMLIRKWVCMADRILTVSKRHAEIISKYMPESKNKIKVLHNPILQVSNFRKEMSTVPCFLYLGGDDYLKGFHVLIPSIKCVIEEHREAKFFLAGSYTKRSAEILKKLSKAYNGKVVVLGKVDHEKVVELHRSCWGFIFPSIIEEPLPYALLESLALGTIPLSSKVGGVVEIMNMIGADYLLVTPGNYKTLCKAMLRIIGFDRDYAESYAYNLSTVFTSKYTDLFNYEFYRFIEEIIT